ncbi:MAG: hypothetical protein KF841_08520 [Phycisphaerae bacterium]|nr:hypothetical protein [Phycisphaerae bacterium]
MHGTTRIFDGTMTLVSASETPLANAIRNEQIDRILKLPSEERDDLFAYIGEPVVLGKPVTYLKYAHFRGVAPSTLRDRTKKRLDAFVDALNR